MKTIVRKIPAWNIIISSLFLFIIFIILYKHVILNLISAWNSDPNSSHGFVIPFISGFFIWQRRELLGKVHLTPSIWGGAVLSGGLSLLVFAHMAEAVTYISLSMFAVIAGIIVFVYGWDLFKKLSFPFFYLLFTVPVPRELYDTVAFPLKLIVTRCSVGILDMMSIPVIREGNIIYLADTTLEVADACSGIRSIVALIAIAVAYTYLFQKTLIRRILLVLSAIPIAVIANGMRVIITGILANSYGAKVAQGFYHEFAGLVIFSVSFALLIGTGVVINKIKSGRNDE